MLEVQENLKLIEKKYPQIHYYDQDFVDLYDKTWSWVEDSIIKGNSKNGFKAKFFNYKEDAQINQFESCFSTFFLTYSNGAFNADRVLDNFYAKQEESGAIRGKYSIEDGKPIFDKDNPECVYPPLFPWAEYNLFHKEGQKKRIKNVVPVLEKYFSWLEKNFRDKETGLYSVPISATLMGNSPRKNVHFPIDFNAQVAMAALYMSALGNLLNDKEICFRYNRHYFSLKVRINAQMWDEEDGFYYDLDKDGNLLKVKTIASYWTMLAELPNEEKVEKMVEYLKDENHFGTEHPFPTLSKSEKEYDPKGNGFCGSVYPPLTFMVIKGLEKYIRYDLARECAIRHTYFVLDSLHPEDSQQGDLWEAYAPEGEGPATWPGRDNFPRRKFIPYLGLTTITLMIENIVGLCISLPRKTVDWIVPTLELMGIENLSLRRNNISILSKKSGRRGWEIRLESEKLYYFTLNIFGKMKKTLPIPSGKCSLLIDKL